VVFQVIRYLTFFGTLLPSLIIVSSDMVVVSHTRTSRGAGYTAIVMLVCYVLAASPAGAPRCSIDAIGSFHI